MKISHLTKMDFSSIMGHKVKPTNLPVLQIVGKPPISVTQHQSLLEAFLQAGIPMYHACGGKGKCTTCRVMILEGEENLSAPAAQEQRAQARMSIPPNVRLACQTRLQTGSVTVQQIIRDEKDRCFYVDTKVNQSISELGKERKLALFFLDIKDFTPFSQAHLPFDVVHILRRLFKIFYEVIQTHQGRIIDTSGGGLYAVFGLEDGFVEATSHAWQAGQAITAALTVENETYFQPFFRHHFQIGMGLHTGNAIIGNLGLDTDDRLSVTGHHVNIASRLQAATRKLNNDFIMSADAYKLLDNPLPIAVQTISLKGVTNPLQIYLVGQPYVEPVALPGASSQ